MSITSSFTGARKIYLISIAGRGTMRQALQVLSGLSAKANASITSGWAGAALAFAGLCLTAHVGGQGCARPHSW